MPNRMKIHWTSGVLFLLMACLGATAVFQSATFADSPIQACAECFWYDRITFDTPQEYEAYVTTNNDAHDYGGSYPVQRITDPEPNRGGALRMLNLRDIGPTSPTQGYVIPARAVLAFGVLSDDSNDQSPVDTPENPPDDDDVDLVEIDPIDPCVPGRPSLPPIPPCAGPIRVIVAFDYLFRSAGGVLTVVARHGILESSLPSVIAPDPGSPGNNQAATWARYDGQWNVGYDDPNSGPRGITLELRGPAGTQVMIDNLVVQAEGGIAPEEPALDAAVPQVRCISHCADIAGIHYYSIGPEDYLAAIYSCRASPLNADASCLDGEFTADGTMSMEDVEYFDWAEAYPPIRSCDSGLAVGSASVQGTLSPLGTPGCTPDAPLLVAGKAYAYDPFNDEHLFLADRIFGFDTGGKAVGKPQTWGEDRLNTRLARDHAGTLYQLNVKGGVVRLSDGRSVLPRCCLPYEGNDVYIGWNKDKGAPPLQDLAFDDSGDVYVVPVLVAPTGKESYRAAARIHLGATAGDNQVVRLYSEPLFISGVHEIELDHAQMVFILDKRHWADSMLLCYDRDSGRLERSRSCGELLQGIMPSAFHVSPRDGRISIVSDNNSLIQASSLDAGPSDIQRTDIRGMSYITDIAEDDSNGAIWLAGFHIESRPNAADVLNGATVFFAPAFKAALARVSRDATGPIEPTTLSDYAIAGKEHLSLPLSIVCTDSGP